MLRAFEVQETNLLLLVHLSIEVAMNLRRVAPTIDVGRFQHVNVNFRLDSMEDERLLITALFGLVKKDTVKQSQSFLRTSSKFSNKGSDSRRENERCVAPRKSKQRKKYLTKTYFLD